MKKIFAIISMLALALCLCSCGNDSEEQTTTTTATTSAEGTGLIVMESPEDDGLGWGDFEVVE